MLTPALAPTPNPTLTPTPPPNPNPNPNVFATQLTSIDAAPSADAAAATEPLLRGRLKLVLARLSNPDPDPNPNPNPDPNPDPDPDPNQVLARLSAGASRAGGDKGPASAGSRRPASAGGGGVGGGSGSIYAEVAGGHVDHEKHKVRLRALPSGAGNLPRAREPNVADEASLYQRQLKRQRQVRPQP